MLQGIIFAILFPVCMSLSLVIIQKSQQKAYRRMSNENFTVAIPEFVAFLGAIMIFIALALWVGVTFFSDEQPHYIFYPCLGLFVLPGAFAIGKTLTFKVVVKGEKITVFSAFRRPYSFTFSQIVSAVRQVKNNRVKSERIVIKTSTGKRLIVEHVEISYDRFVKKILSEVSAECLVGFK